MRGSHRRFNAQTDWGELHARLARTVVTTREALAPSPARDAMLLEQRARRLAQPVAADRAAGSALDLLTFMLTGERFGIETRHVQEVFRFSGLTPVPGVPEVVAGVANLRGQILVVFDIRRLFGLAPKTFTDASRIVICGNAQPDLGILVDCVDDVVRLPADELVTDAVAHDQGGASFIRGITGEAIIVLDGAALVTDQRLFVDQSHRQ